MLKSVKMIIKRIRCKHTHTFRHFLPSVPWYFKGEKRGTHDGILIEGCYLCGKVWCRDFQA